MKTQITRLSWLIGLTIGLVLCLIIAPATRWIVKYQVIQGLLGRHDVLNPHQMKMDAIASTMPEDLEIQTANLAVQFNNGQGDSIEKLNTRRIQDLRAYVRHFHGSAAACATAMRFMCFDLKFYRTTGVDENQQLASPKKITDLVSQRSYTQSLKEFEVLAAEGEKLDTENGYFPFMQAACLIEQHRDNEALDAIIRAGKKSKFEDYPAVELAGKFRLYDYALGGHSSITRTTAYSSVLLPQLSVLRGVAKTAIAFAEEIEKKRDYERGFQIRVALRKTGALMRSQCDNLIGNLVGIAISPISMTIPTGILTPVNIKTKKGEELQKYRLKEYSGYLNRIHHSEEIAAMNQEIKAGKQVKALVRQVAGNMWGAYPLVSIWWIAGSVILFNIMSLSLYSLVLSLVRKLKPMQDREPLSLPLKKGITISLYFILVGIILGEKFPSEPSLLIIHLIISVCVLIAWNYRGGKSAIQTGFGGFFMTILVLGLTVLIQIFLTRGFAKAAMFPASAISGSVTSSEPDVFLMTYLLFITTLTSTVLTIGAALVSLVKREPLVSGIVHRMTMIAIPSVCLLTLIWCSVIMGQARVEKVQNDRLMQIIHGEGQYYAKALHQPWPGN